MNGSLILELEDLHRRFGGVVALNGVSLKVPEGSIFGIIGPNGAGKTTLFNVVTGVYAPTAGSIRFRGGFLARRPEEIVRAGIARTYQNIRLFHSMTVLQHILLAQTVRRVHGMNWLRSTHRVEPETREMADELLHVCGLWERRHDLATALPYGLQRRVEIARALATEPQLLLLDEPAAGMNESESTELAKIVDSFRQRGLTVLLIEHDMPFVMRLCDRIAVLNFGSKIAEASPEEIRRDPVVLEAYLGKEEAS